MVIASQEATMDKIPDKHMSHSLEAYVGEYLHPYYGSCTVWLEDVKEDQKENKNGAEKTAGAGEAKNEALVSSLWSVRTLISHLHFDTFVLKHDHPGFEVTYVASFHTGSDGKVNAIHVEMGADTFVFKKAKVVKEEKEEKKEKEEKEEKEDEK